MKNPKISQKSPIVLNTKPDNYYFCTCGQSEKQPFCDDSHQDTEFIPEKIEIFEEKNCMVCM